MSNSKLGWGLLICLVLICTLPLTRFGKTNAMWLERTAFLYAHSDEITDLVVGNSRARSLRFEEMGLVGVSNHFGAATPHMTHEALQDILPRLPQVERVWMPVVPTFLFEFRERSIDRVAGAPFLLVYWKAAFDDLWSEPKDWLQRVRSGQADDRALRKFHAGVPVRRDGMTSETWQGQLEVYIKARLGTLGDSQINVAPMLHLVDTARKHGVEVIVFVPPMLREHYEDPRISKFLGETDAALAELDRLGADVTVLDHHDFYFDLPLGDVLKRFSDPSHLNERGAREFSAQLGRWLAER